MASAMTVRPFAPNPSALGPARTADKTSTITGARAATKP